MGRRRGETRQGSVKGGVMGSGKGKGLGGERRTAECPCGYIVKGQRQTLKPKIRCHQKVCEECAGLNLSYIWNKKPEFTNLTDLKGGCQYSTGKGGGFHTNPKVAAFNDDNPDDVKLFELNSTSGNISAAMDKFKTGIEMVADAQDTPDDCPEVFFCKTQAEADAVKYVLEMAGGEDDEFFELSLDALETPAQKKRRVKKEKKQRDVNERIGLRAVPNDQLNPFELDYKEKVMNPKKGSLQSKI